MSASLETLMEQASMTAHQYFHAAIKTIDAKFADGYAEKHPELIGAFLQAAATDFHTAVFAQELQKAASSIADAITNRT